MEVGYIGRYFNSYFDGSATIDELVAAGLYEDLVTRDKSLRDVATPRGLVDKYSNFAAPFAYDEAFFREMDARGRWIAIPYPAVLAAVHHRERFRTAQREQYETLCRAIEPSLGPAATREAAQQAP